MVVMGGVFEEGVTEADDLLVLVEGCVVGGGDFGDLRQGEEFFQHSLIAVAGGRWTTASRGWGRACRVESGVGEGAAAHQVVEGRAGAIAQEVGVHELGWIGGEVRRALGEVGVAVGGRVIPGFYVVVKRHRIVHEEGVVGHHRRPVVRHGHRVHHRCQRGVEEGWLLVR